MKQIRNNLPNALTLLNLLCGALAAVRLMEGDVMGAQLLIGCSLLFDLFDGALARALKVSSPLGKDLDSLADVVSFGFTPSLLLYVSMHETGAMPFWLCYIAFLPLLAAAVRLARFNQSSEQHRSFIGLPTPASGIIIMSLPFLWDSNISSISGLIQVPAFLLAITLITSAMMVSRVRLFSLKMSSFGFRENIHRYLMILVMAATLVLAWSLAGLLFLLFYLSISLAFRSRIIAEEKG